MRASARIASAQSGQFLVGRALPAGAGTALTVGVLSSTGGGGDPARFTVPGVGIAAGRASAWVRSMTFDSHLTLGLSGKAMS